MKNNLRAEGCRVTGTIIINGQRFTGNKVEIRNGKVVIDGIAQDGGLRRDVEAQVVEGVVGHTKSAATVRCSAAQFASGLMQAVAAASAGKGRLNWKKR